MKFRTVHVSTQTGWGGGEQQILYLIEGLRRRGHDAILATRPESLLAERGRRAGVEIFPIRPINEGDPVAAWRLATILRDLQTQILHLHAPHAHLLGVLAARLVPGVATVVSRRVDFSIYRRLTLGLNWLKYRFGVDHFIAVSRAVRDTLARDGVPESRISVVHSGVDLELRGWRPDEEDAAAVRRDLGLPGDVPIVASAGALHRNKGADRLIEATARIRGQRDAALVVVGEGKQRSKLEKLARRLGVSSRVHLPGFRWDVLSVLAASSVYAQASYREGLNTSILDALCLGLPVVATRVGGIPEVIEDRRHGLLVPPGDTHALGDSLLELLERPELGRSIAGAGQKRVRQTFSVDAMVDGTLEVYRKVLNGATACEASKRAFFGHRSGL